MSGKTIAITVIVLLIAGAGVFAAVRGTDDETAGFPEPGSTAEGLPQPSDEPTQPSGEARVAGSYVDYRDGIIQESQGQRVLFFHAPWCPQCRSIEKGIKADGVPDGFTVIKVDYDSNQALRKKYGIKIQTSFIKVDENGNAQGQPFVAYDDPQFSFVVDNFLNS